MAGELERAIMQNAFDRRMGFPDRGGLTRLQKGQRGVITPPAMFDETYATGATMPQTFGQVAPMPAMRPEFSGPAPMPAMRPGYGIDAPLPSMRPPGGLLGAMQNFSAPMPSMRPATAAAIARAIPSARSDPAAPVSAGYAPNYRAAPDYGAPRHRPGQDVSEPISDPNSRTNASIGKSFASDVRKAFSRSARSDPSSPVSGGGRSGGSLK